MRHPLTHRFSWGTEDLGARADRHGAWNGRVYWDEALKF